MLQKRAIQKNIRVTEDVAAWMDAHVLSTNSLVAIQEFIHNIAGL
ncbi:MAG: hypothetical protein QM642_09370 [Edaphocola sp.]